MHVGTIYSRQGTVYLNTVDGSILDGNGDLTNIQAKTVFLTAIGGAIGTSGDYLDFHTTGVATAGIADDGTITATATGSGGGVFLSETDGDMHVRNILSETGDVGLKAAISILDAVDIATPTAGGHHRRLSPHLHRRCLADVDRQSGRQRHGPLDQARGGHRRHRRVTATKGSTSTRTTAAAPARSPRPAASPTSASSRRSATFFSSRSAPASALRATRRPISLRAAKILNGRNDENSVLASGKVLLTATGDIGASDKN